MARGSKSTPLQGAPHSQPIVGLICLFTWSWSCREGEGSSSLEGRVERGMQALGRERAQRFGWQDTYVFSKALGEMMLWRERGSFPVAVRTRTSLVNHAPAGP